jgi:hypothetical protein
MTQRSIAATKGSVCLHCSLCFLRLLRPLVILSPSKGTAVLARSLPSWPHSSGQACAVRPFFCHKKHKKPRGREAPGKMGMHSRHFFRGNDDGEQRVRLVRRPGLPCASCGQSSSLPVESFSGFLSALPVVKKRGRKPVFDRITGLNRINRLHGWQPRGPLSLLRVLRGFVVESDPGRLVAAMLRQAIGVIRGQMIEWTKGQSGDWRAQEIILEGWNKTNRFRWPGSSTLAWLGRQCGRGRVRGRLRRE